MSKSYSLQEAEPSFDPKFDCSDNPVQNIWNKVKKPSKIGQY